MTDIKNNQSNPYYRCSKISADDFEVLLHHYCHCLDVSLASERSGVSVRSVKAIFEKLHQRLANEIDPDNKLVGQYSEGQIADQWDQKHEPRTYQSLKALLLTVPL